MLNDGDEVETWFKLRLESLRMVETQLPSLDRLKKVLSRHLLERFERALNHIFDENDVEEWLDLVLKCDVLL